MREIAAMTERIVRKAKEYNRDTVPGDYATLSAPCPQCGGVVKENYHRYCCTGAAGAGPGCGFSLPKSPGGRVFELQEVEALLRTHRIGPLEGFRSKAGRPFSAVLNVAPDASGQWKLEFDFGNEDKGDDGELVDLAGRKSLGACPKCGSPVVEHGSHYVCSRAVPTVEQPAPTCDFKSAATILQQPIAPEQMAKLLATGRTDWLEGFVSNRTRRPFKAALVWDAEAGKVNFAFEPREGARAPARRTGAHTGTRTATPRRTAPKR
ncbi:MAG: topoisomerase C-terminal repeat-containing protein, partial [Tepidimonas sp.]|uniref:topoisomerase C-terminal repeat-containing protein n=1 Tax=Tepidimonas sp. TaxID=2002775 RepID=UPI0040551459